MTTSRVNKSLDRINVSDEIRAEVTRFLTDPAVRTFAKNILVVGLEKDLLDAKRDAVMAANLLAKIEKNSLDRAVDEITYRDVIRTDPWRASAGQRQDGEPYCDRS